jgi:hypothetical protein
MGHKKNRSLMLIGFLSGIQFDSKEKAQELVEKGGSTKCPQGSPIFAF